jgi:hypothetical protein|tara:strand:+ start:121 stop:444 length:324 start_codon:yes stop_codon:yes gene_type:complete
MMMTIPKDKYDELKPYYDFQRQKEFNKDWCRAVVQKVCSLSDGIIGYDEDSATELLWLHMKEEEYQTPPKNYVPDDPNWRIEGEDYEDWKKVRQNIMIMNQYIWRKK